MSSLTGQLVRLLHDRSSRCDAGSLQLDHDDMRWRVVDVFPNVRLCLCRKHVVDLELTGEDFAVWRGIVRLNRHPRRIQDKSLMVPRGTVPEDIFCPEAVAIFGQRETATNTPIGQ